MWLPRPGRPEYEQRRLVIAPGAEHVSEVDEWADALVFLDSGRLELESQAGARWVFHARAMLCLSWLPLSTLRSAGFEPAVLMAFRRRRDQAIQPDARTYHGVNGDHTRR